MIRSYMRRALVGAVATASVIGAGTLGVPSPAAAAAGQPPAAIPRVMWNACDPFGAPIITLDPGVIAVGQQPGRKLIAYGLRNGWDVLLIVVDDAPGLARNQMRLVLDIDPVGMTGRRGVTWTKEIQASGQCHRDVSAAVTSSPLPSSMLRVCSALGPTNDFYSGCTSRGSVIINRAQVSELWLRKPGFLGIWGDAEAIDSSFWSAFGGRTVRFIWRAD